jgi:hypothetical protein
MVQLTIDVQDELLVALGAEGTDLPRAGLEAIALEAYRGQS